MRLRFPLVNSTQMEKILSKKAWDAGTATKSSAIGFNSGYIGCRSFQNDIFMSARFCCEISCSSAVFMHSCCWRALSTASVLSKTQHVPIAIDTCWVLLNTLAVFPFSVSIEECVLFVSRESATRHSTMYMYHLQSSVLFSCNCANILQNYRKSHSKTVQI